MFGRSECGDGADSGGVEDGDNDEKSAEYLCFPSPRPINSTMLSWFTN